ncbi:hypothetical protein BDR05DRAFT_1005132 [Suillus weaverae]|nr:hypothetical protein BDR05DRAFT_1005132 [Suillus weaverae]
MLALLKPWRHIADIKKPTDSFSSTFNDFAMHAPQVITRILANIQYFHECSDKAKSEREKDFSCNFASPNTGDHLDDDTDEIMLKEDEKVEDDEDISEDDIMLKEDEKVEDDEDISEDDIMQAMEGSVNAREILYAEVALNIAEEFQFFDEDNYPITIINHPARPASHKDLQQSLDWQHSITISDGPHLNSLTSPSLLDSMPASMNTNASVSRNPMVEISVTTPSYLNKEQTMAFIFCAITF